MKDQSLEEYFYREKLDQYINEPQSDTRDVFDAVTGGINEPIPPNLEDIVRLHQMIRKNMSFTVLEFGVGFSTLIIADALKKNKNDWGALQSKPRVRNRYMFKCFSVDSSKKWINKTSARLPNELSSIVEFSFSEVSIGTYQGQLCSYYDKLPDIVPDFIYLDGPDPKAVKGSIGGLSFQCDERTVNSGDILLMEPTLLPGTTILVDGRTNNARFLANNFKRNFSMEWDRTGDITIFKLNEERLGKYNVLGSDFIRNPTV